MGKVYLFRYGSDILMLICLHLLQRDLEFSLTDERYFDHGQPSDH